MTDWSRAEEEQFCALVRRAEAQSWDYYQRSGAQPEPPPPQPEPVYQPQPTSQPEPPPPLPEPPPEATPPPQPEFQQASYWVNPNCLPLPAPQPPQSPPPGRPSRPQPSTSLLKLPFHLDSETLLLAALLWLLVEEEADWPLLLALAYILIV